MMYLVHLCDKKAQMAAIFFTRKKKSNLIKIANNINPQKQTNINKLLATPATYLI